MNAALLKLTGVLFFLLTFVVTGCGANRSDTPLDKLQASSEDGCSLSEESRSPSAVITPTSIDLPITVATQGNPTTRAKVWIAPGAKRGIIFVSGVDGGFLEPAPQYNGDPEKEPHGGEGDGIYTRMAEKLYRQCVSSIFVEYRYSGGYLAESVQDTLSAANYLRAHGVRKMAIAGWSFGGAVISHSAVQIPEVVTILGFAPQSLYTEPLAKLTSRHSVLLFHSRDDENIDFSSSEIVYDTVPESVERVLYPLAKYLHRLNGAGDKIDSIVERWLKAKLLGLPATS